jgi:hypothetical protein
MSIDATMWSWRSPAKDSLVGLMGIKSLTANQCVGYERIVVANDLKT